MTRKNIKISKNRCGEISPQKIWEKTEMEV
jgi:hypothetical protein